MKIYFVRLVFNMVMGTDASRFDEQLRMIRSSSAEDALLKAQALGRREEETFIGEHGQQVKWKFTGATEIFDLAEYEDQSLLCSRTVKKSDPVSYINFNRQKAMEMQVKNVTFA